MLDKSAWLGAGERRKMKGKRKDPENEGAEAAWPRPLTAESSQVGSGAP